MSMVKLRRKKKINLEYVLERQQEQIQHLSKRIEQIAELVIELKFQRPPAENIRVVTQKTVEEPKTDFEKVLNWTTNQTNQHLNSLTESDLQDIIQSALTGKPVPEKSDAKPTGSDMTKYLNDNYGTIVNQEDVWNTIADAKANAKQRIAQIGADAVDLVEIKKELKKLG